MLFSVKYHASKLTLIRIRNPVINYLEPPANGPVISISFQNSKKQVETAHKQSKYRRENAP